MNEYPIQPCVQEQAIGIFWWAQNRGIKLWEEDCDRLWSNMAFVYPEDEVRWGRALNEMMADVISELSARDLHFDMERRFKGFTAEPYKIEPFRHSTWFVAKYPELKDLFG